MPTTTTTYSFNKPVVGADEDSWGEYLNGNWDSVDNLLDGTTPVTGIDINSGTIDNVVIGGATPAAGTFTTLTANTSITGTLATAAQPNITSVGSLTSLDVAGAITSDGLTVDGNANVDGSLNFTNQGIVNAYINSEEGFYFNVDSNNDQSTERVIQFGANASDDSGKKIALLQESGDISFYEDTGTTPKFFWDASAERLGIGTTSPAAAIEVVAGSDNNANNGLVVKNPTGGTRFAAYTEENVGVHLQANEGGSARAFMFDVGGTEAMRIDSSGNVGIGRIPATRLDVEVTDATVFSSSSSGNILTLRNTNTTSGNFAGIAFSSSGTGGDAATAHINVTGTTSGNGNLVFSTRGSSTVAERMRIDSSGNVGIGTNAATGDLDIYRSSSDPNIRITRGTTQSRIATTSAGGLRLQADYGNTAANSFIQFSVDGSEAMRLDASGNLLVGKTSNDNGATRGIEVESTGQLNACNDDALVSRFNRLTSDGDIVSFRKDGTTVGSIGTQGGGLHIAHTVSGLFFGTNLVAPCDVDGTERDNLVDLGNAGRRFDDIYATNGTIQTSDRNEKQDIAELSDAEQRVAVAAKGLLRKFRWRDAVAEKGDEARTHFGIIAQDLQAAFAAEGLDAGDYAMFIHTTWTDEETGEERSRMGVRYSELLAFIIAAI
jgi:hypothetical protein